MSVLLYVHQKREAIWALSLPVTGQGSTPCSLISLSILYVLLRTLFVMSHPSYLAWKGEEHRIQKTQTSTTLSVLVCVCAFNFQENVFVCFIAAVSNMLFFSFFLILFFCSQNVLNSLKKRNKKIPYNRVCIPASRQPNFYLLWCLAAAAI